jgi:hypothetical protein
MIHNKRVLIWRFTLVLIKINYGEIACASLDINVCPIPVKTDVGQVDLVLRLSDGTSENIPKCAGTTDISISTGIKYWVC